MRLIHDKRFMEAFHIILLSLNGNLIRKRNVFSRFPKNICYLKIRFLSIN